MRFAVVVVVSALSLATVRPALADDASSVAAATVLFDEGVKLMDAGRAAEACPKLARSQALAPSGGTLLALGDCYEKTDRTASAWLAFREAATRAASAGKRDAEAAALERARRLEAKMPRLVITVPQSTQVPGLEVRRDGIVLKDAELGVPVPADPGSHEVRATAPHMKPSIHAVTTRAGETVDYAVPPLAQETADTLAPVTQPPPDDTTNPPPTSPSSPGKTQRIAGIVVAAVGVVSLGVGGYFGILASNKNKEALETKNCPTSTRCNPSGLTLTNQATTRALVSTILVIVGATGLAVGGVVFFTAPKSSSTAVAINPSVGLGSAGGTATVLW